jgi:hypothetical protein
MRSVALTAEQERELRRYEDGEPHQLEGLSNTNMIRRNLITRVGGGTGVGVYRITPLGRAALAEREGR